MNKIKIVSVTTLAAALTICGPTSAQPAQPASSLAEIRGVAEKAYLYAYPLVLMEFTRRAAMQQATFGGASSMNQFNNAAEFPNASFRQVIRPNADTLYSLAWLDLSKEPMLLEVPDTHGRYYLMQFMDAWTETFSAPGKRTTGTGEGWFAIAGPGWKGKLPERAQRIDSPTNMVWIIGRTQTNNASDYDNVHAIQKGFRLMPMSLYPDGQQPESKHPPAPRSASATAPPPVQVSQLGPVEFFRVFTELLNQNPPHAADEAMVRDLARIGIVPGKPFKPDGLGVAGMQGLEEGMKAATSRLAALDGRVGQPAKNGWSGGGGKVGRYGTDYLARAMVARIGLGLLPPEDATYMQCLHDSGGQTLEGANRYRLHFDKGNTPPVRAFWSVTMYSEDGYFVPNPINRFAIGDRDPLKLNADGSLDLYIQHAAPGGDKNANWLPAPEGKFNLSLRMYWPKEEVLVARWTPPAVSKD